MAFSIKCPHCERVHKVGPEASGKRVTCGACKKSFRAPTFPAKGQAATGQKVWSLHVDGETLGPFAAAEIVKRLEAGKIDGSTIAWKDGLRDWEELAAISEFTEAVATAKAPAPPSGKAAAPKKKLRHRGEGAAAPRAAKSAPAVATRSAEPPEEGEHRPHFAPRKRRDIVIGAWVAGVLAVVALIIILATASSRQPKTQQQKRRERARKDYDKAREGRRGDEDGKSGEGGPKSPAAAAGMTPQGLRLLGDAETSLAKQFNAAIEAHKKGDIKPIKRLGTLLHHYVETMGKRDWGRYKTKVLDPLVAELVEAAKAIDGQTSKRAGLWRIGARLPEAERAHHGSYDQVEWLTNWQGIVAEQFKVLRDKHGLKL